MNLDGTEGKTILQTHSTFKRALISRNEENVIGLIITMVAMLRYCSALALSAVAMMILALLNRSSARISLSRVGPSTLGRCISNTMTFGIISFRRVWAI